MNTFITRAYNKFKHDPLFGTITKISKEEKLKDEIEYLTHLPAELSIFFPRILEHGKNKSGYFLKMEKYAYRNLGDIMIYDKFKEKRWTKIAKQINKVLTIFSKYECPIKIDTLRNISTMYIEKTDREYEKLILGNKHFNTIALHVEIEINGKAYKNFRMLWRTIINYIIHNIINKRRKNLSVIHGDMCFSNILCGENDDVILKFIDPRGSFGSKGTVGDWLYDLAKLCHSYDGGYEYIIYDKFNVSWSKDLRSFEFAFDNNNKDKIKKVFDKILYDKNAKLIEGLIFIGMCARHYDSYNRQLAMYLTGVKLLNEFVEENNL